VAQLGSALDWGSRGRRFKSCRPDGEMGGSFSTREPPIGVSTCKDVDISDLEAELETILVSWFSVPLHAQLEQIWSTPSGAAKWGQGLLQVCGVVLVTSDRLGSVRDGLVRRRLGCRRGGVPSSRGRVAGFAAAGAYAARSGAAARGAGFAPGSARWMGTGTWFGSSSRFGVDVAPGHRSVLEASMRGAMGRCRGHHVGAARAPFRDLPGRVICVPCQGRKHVRHMCCRTTYRNPRYGRR
jgi:hypothetical protein